MKLKLAREIAARIKPSFIELPRERGGTRVPFTEEQLTAMRGGLTAEEYRWKLTSECDGERSQIKGAVALGLASNPLLKYLVKFLERAMKPRNNRRLIVIPVLIRISSHDPTPPPTHAAI